MGKRVSSWPLGAHHHLARASVGQGIVFAWKFPRRSAAGSVSVGAGRFSRAVHLLRVSLAQAKVCHKNYLSTTDVSPDFDSYRDLVGCTPGPAIGLVCFVRGRDLGSGWAFLGSGFGRGGGVCRGIRPCCVMVFAVVWRIGKL
jgi:hypothetical protein